MTRWRARARVGSSNRRQPSRNEVEGHHSRTSRSCSQRLSLSRSSCVVYLIEAREPLLATPRPRHGVYDRWARSMLDGGGLGGNVGGAPFTQRRSSRCSSRGDVCIPRSGSRASIQGAPPADQCCRGRVHRTAAGRWKDHARRGSRRLLALAKPVIFYTGVLLPELGALLSAAFLAPSHGNAARGHANFSAGAIAGLLAGLPSPWRNPPLLRSHGRVYGAGHALVDGSPALAAIAPATLLWNGVNGSAWRRLGHHRPQSLRWERARKRTAATCVRPACAKTETRSGRSAARCGARRARRERVLTFGPADADRYWTQAASR